MEKLAWEWMATNPEKAREENEYYCPTRDVFQARVDRFTADLNRNNISEENAYIISAIAGEIGNNSFDHNLGKWPDVIGIFFGCENFDGKFKIILADRGQGILATLKKVKPELKNDSQSLETAFTERISGRMPERRGNGLKFVKENVEAKKMRLSFFSGNAQAELNDKMEIKKAERAIRGCLAILVF